MFETWIETDLTKLPTVMKLMGRVFTQDNVANKIGVIVKDGGEDFTLTGTVKGYVILPDGTMINDISGSSDGNRAWVILPSSAYAQQGQITISVKIINGNTVSTLGAVEAYVYPSIL